MNLSNVLTGLFIFHSLADPLFLLPEYINGLNDSLISLKRIEVFLNKKEYNPIELIKNIKPSKDEKIAIEIDGLDFGIIKKREEFMKDTLELEKEKNKENNDNDNKKDIHEENNNKNGEKENKIEEKEIELQDIELNKDYENKEEEDEKNEKIKKLLTKTNTQDQTKNEFKS